MQTWDKLVPLFKCSKLCCLLLQMGVVFTKMKPRIVVYVIFDFVLKFNEVFALISPTLTSFYFPVPPRPVPSWTKQNKIEGQTIKSASLTSPTGRRRG